MNITDNQILTNETLINFTLNKTAVGHTYTTFVSIDANAIIPDYCVRKMFKWGCETQITIANRFMIVFAITNLYLLLNLIYNIMTRGHYEKGEQTKFILYLLNFVMTLYLFLV